MRGCPQDKNKMYFCHATFNCDRLCSIMTVFELCKFLKFNATIIYTVLPSSN